MSRRADRNIRWIEAHCKVPEGAKVGKPIKLEPFQRNVIEATYAEGIRRSIISVGRKNGKTALSACLLLLHLMGPEALRNSQLYSTAQSREQAGIVFELARKMVLQSPDMQAALRISVSAKRITCPELGTVYRALSADAHTAYGLSPRFVVHDELGQVRGPTSELYEAIETATGAHEKPLSVIISTQAPTDDDLLSLLIDDADKDPTTALSFFTASDECDVDDIAAIRAANPALGKFQTESEVLAMADAAKRIPAREAAFRNLVLNQRISTKGALFTRAVWESLPECGPPPEGARVVAGIDLSSRTDLTAIVYIWRLGNGRWGSWPRFFMPANDIVDRGKADHAPYALWAREGWLHAIPGPVIEYKHIAEMLMQDYEKYQIIRIAYDRWNWKHFRSWMVAAGFEPDVLDGVGKRNQANYVPRLVEPFGQGYVSMSPAIASLESAVLKGDLAQNRSPVMNMCVSGAVITSDPAGNRKLDKSESTSRIDGLIALCMAVAMAEEFLVADAGPITSPYDDPDFGKERQSGRV